MTTTKLSVKKISQGQGRSNFGGAGASKQFLFHPGRQEPVGVDQRRAEGNRVRPRQEVKDFRNPLRNHFSPKQRKSFDTLCLRFDEKSKLPLQML